MGKKIISMLLTLLIACTSIPVSASAAENTLAPSVDFSGFIAPIDDPDAGAIKISTAQELAAINDNPYGSYVLTKDIDLSGQGNWSPVGTSLKSAFHGKLDGQGHKITGLTVKETFGSGTLFSTSYVVGLFGVCDGAQIKNIAFEDADISIITTSGYSYPSAIDSSHSIYAGIIAGYTKNGTVIYNCHTSGTVLAKAHEEGCSDAYAGGLVGWADTALFSYSYNTASVQGYNGNTVQAYNAYAGGLAGSMKADGIIDRSYNCGSVTSRTLDYGNAVGGGLIGNAQNASVKVTDSFNEGTVESVTGNLFCDTAYAGGIAGNFSGSIEKVYNCGSVTANASDQFGIFGSTSYAGGLCGISAVDSVIKNSAVLQSAVIAYASGTKYQYRICYQGSKDNNITVSPFSSGSTNDAALSRNVDELKTYVPYSGLLGWDFDTIWEMIPGKDFPQLKRVDTKSEEYEQDYTQQHLDFMEGRVYANILNNYRWAQIYWSDENNFKSNAAGALYAFTDTAVDLVTLNFADLFADNDPFKVILADYIADESAIQEYKTLYKVEFPLSLDKVYKKAEKFIKANWKDEYGKLDDKDLFYLFHYDDKGGEDWINEDFQNHLSEIVYGDKNGTFDTVLGITSETMHEVLDNKAFLDQGISYLNGLFKYAASLDAYRQTDNCFKKILKMMRYNYPTETDYIRYSSKFINALESYIDVDESEDDITAFEVKHYFGNSWKNEAADFIALYVKQKKSDWMKYLVKVGKMSQATLNAYNKIANAADKTWKVMEYVTKMVNCRNAVKCCGQTLILKRQCIIRSARLRCNSKQVNHLMMPVYLMLDLSF